MMRTSLLLGMGLGLSAPWPKPAQAPTTFTVRIENVSTGTSLKASDGTTHPAPTSPGLWIVHTGRGHLFTSEKADAGLGLEQQAEEGNPAKLIESIRAHSDVLSSGTFLVPVGDVEPGPLLPGKVFEWTITAEPGAKLSFATMFAQSNDLFYAPDEDGIALFDSDGKPIGGDITTQLLLWDAGTEVNQEPGIGKDQAPRQPAPNTGANENGTVRRVDDGFTYPRVSDVIRVTITPSVADASVR
jgi:hypothetical protein